MSKSKSLYQIDEDWRALEDALWESDGILTEEMEETFAELLQAHGDKAEGYVALIQIAIEEEKMYKSQAKRLTDLAKSAGTRAKSLKDRLLVSMQQRGDTEYETPIGKVKVTPNGGNAPLVLTVDDPAELPERFQRVTVSADTDAIRAALDEGDAEAQKIAYEAERGEHLRIR